MKIEQPAKKSKEENVELKKANIIDSAMTLIEQKDFYEIGMRDIAVKSGISPATIYRFFSSRDDLFVEALITIISSFEKQFEDIIKNENTKIEDIAILIIDYMLDNEPIFQIMSHFMTRGQITPDTLSKFNIVQRYFLGMFDNALIKAGAKGKVRLFSHAFFASLTGIIMSFRNYPGRGKQEIRKHMHRLVKILSFFFNSGMPAIPEGFEYF